MRDGEGLNLIKLVQDDAPVPKLPCSGLTDLFFGDELDGRDEKGRAERELLCEAVCWTCPLRMECLHRAMLKGEYWGVWGAMGEGERRSFKEYLKEQGFDDIFEDFGVFKVWLRRYYVAGPRLRRLQA